MKIKALILLITAAALFPGYSLEKSDYFEEFSAINSAEEWERGLDVFTLAVTQYPGEVNFHCYLNEMLRKLGKNEEALVQITPVFQSNQDNTYALGCYKWSLIEYGLEMRNDNNLKEALALLLQAFELDNNDITTTLWYGILLKETGDIDLSIEVLEDGEERFDNHYITSNLIYSRVEKANQVRNENPAAAEELYIKALELDDENVTAVLWWGIFLKEQKRFEESVAVLERGIEFSDNQYLHSNLLYSYVDYANEIRSDRPAAAENLYRKALEIDDTNLTPLLWYGIFLNEQERYESALEFFYKGLDLYPDNEYLPGNINHAYFHYGQSLVEKGESEKALGIYEEAVNRFPENLYYYFYLFTGYMELEKLAEAEESLIRWCRAKVISPLKEDEIFTEENNIYYRTSDLIKKYVFTGEFDKAFSLYDNIGRYFTNQHLILNGRGELLWFQENKKEGIALINRAYEQYIADHPEYTNPIYIGLPMKGTFVVACGNESDTTMTHAGLARYCFDFMSSDEDGQTTRPGTEGMGANEDYYGFGEPVYSPVDGVVVSAEDNGVDHEPIDGWAYHLPGNHITIQDENKYNYVFVHNKHHTARVKEGDRVTAGQQIAELGNTASSVPHLHFGVWSEDWSVSIPVRFTRYVEITGNDEGEREKIIRINATPEQGAVIFVQE